MALLAGSAIGRTRLGRARRVRAAQLLACALGLLGGCGEQAFSVRGTVHDVGLEYGQVVIAHEDIPGLMPAMTMNFSVPDPAVLSRLAPGQVIEFQLARRGADYIVLSFELLGFAPEEEGWLRLGDAMLRADPTADFTLQDQQGRPFRLSQLAGRGVLLDFIYTECPGPCPIQTANQVAVQRRLSARAAASSWFVSVSLDPSRDDPAALRAYAKRHSARLEGWSFLTGPVADVERVIRDFGVGRLRAEDGSIEHMSISFLLDHRGRIVKRYIGLAQDPALLAADLEGLAAALPARAADPAS